MISLKLANNNMTYVLPSISRMTKLETLDLSYNSLSCLSTITMKALDDIQTYSNNFTLYLTDNTFTGTCKCIIFFQWLLTTKVQIFKKVTVECILDSLLYKMTPKVLPMIIKQLDNECFSTAWLHYSTALTTFILGAITLGSVTFRYTYSIRATSVSVAENKNESKAKPER